MKTFSKNLGWLAASAFLVACGGSQAQEGVTTPDGETKSVADGKADAWNARNDPRLFRTELNYKLADLPLEAKTETTPWTASYWPYYKDGINDRWQGTTILSPAEKYDKAFNGWEPKEGFMDLKPFSTETCEWDDEYYSSLGPAANWTSLNKGNAKARNGRDDDGDGLSDAEECGGFDNEVKLDGVETWWGICHAWAPAAFMEKEPLATVVRDGVEFTVSDQKALLMSLWDRASAHMVGGRCNDKEVERDEETNRITNSECRDLNPGSWHVLVTNLIGLGGRAMVIERTFDYEVWNQPLFGYDISKQDEISLERVNELLNIRTEEGGNGTLVLGIEEESRTAQGMLNLVNGASKTQLDEEVGLRADAARGIVEFRAGADGEEGTDDDQKFVNLEQLADVNRVGEVSFQQMAEYANANNLVPLEYAYNDEAVKFVEVKMSTKWLTEQHASTDRTDDVISRYTRSDYYHYILELDANDEIIGGEWVGSSIMAHPDFVWLPVRDYGGNPHLDAETIRSIVDEGRTIALGDAEPVVEAFNYVNGESVEIPDNDQEGVSSLIEVADKGTITSARVSVDIEHTYRGDIIVELRHAGLSAEVYNGRTAENGWDDDVVIDNLELEIFKGVELNGDWELFVYDTWAQDTGALRSFKLAFDVEQ